MNPPTLLRKFISLFWLKKDCFQLAINKTRLGNRERSTKKRRLKIVLGLLLLMTPCWSSWNLSDWYKKEIGHAQVCLSCQSIENSWSILWSKEVPFEDFHGEEKRSLVVTWNESWLEQGKCFHEFGRRSWSACFSLLTFRTYIPCHDTTVDTWHCWRTFGTLHGPCDWQ